MWKPEEHFCIHHRFECDAHPQYVTTSVHLDYVQWETKSMHKSELIAKEVTDAYVHWKRKGKRMELI